MITLANFINLYFTRGTQRQFSENIGPEDDVRSRTVSEHLLYNFLLDRLS